MEFTLPEQFVKDNGLTEDQVKALTSHVAGEFIPNIKKELNDAANTNAENILSGAAKYAAEDMKIALERNQGEKWGDYLRRLHGEGLKAKNEAIATKEKELAVKLKDFDGGAAQKAEIDRLTQELDKYKQTAAELEPLRGLDEKYKSSQEQLSGLKLSVAFSSVRPNFPDTVNQYEANAKWDAFRKSVMDKYNLEIVENEAIAISKENEHLRKPLKELVEKDETISALLAGRQQGGTGATPQGKLKVEGVPFELPKGATSEELSRVVRDYVEKDLKIPFTDPTFSAKFQELYGKAKEGLSKAA